MFGTESAEKDEELYFSDDSDIGGDDFEKKKKSSPLVMSDSDDEIEEVPQPTSSKKTKGKITNKAVTTGKKKVCLNLKIEFRL